MAAASEVRTVIAGCRLTVAEQAAVRSAAAASGASVSAWLRQTALANAAGAQDARRPA